MVNQIKAAINYYDEIKVWYKLIIIISAILFIVLIYNVRIFSGYAFIDITSGYKWLRYQIPYGNLGKSYALYLMVTSLIFSSLGVIVFTINSIKIIPNWLLYGDRIFFIADVVFKLAGLFLKVIAYTLLPLSIVMAIAMGFLYLFLDDDLAVLKKVKYSIISIREINEPLQILDYVELKPGASAITKIVKREIKVDKKYSTDIVVEINLDNLPDNGLILHSHSIRIIFEESIDLGSGKGRITYPSRRSPSWAWVTGLAENNIWVGAYDMKNYLSRTGCYSYFSVPQDGSRTAPRTQVRTKLEPPVMKLVFSVPNHVWQKKKMELVILDKVIGEIKPTN